MADCVFCKIASRAIPAALLYEDSDVVAFEDGAPQAPFHALVIPRAHVSTLNDLSDERIGGRLMQVVRRVASDAGHAGGYRVVINSGGAVGQSVRHLHLHVLAGRHFGWPPG
jgi:histidine triad (HIT) family protein